MLVGDLNDNNVIVDSSIAYMDDDIRNDGLEYLLDLTNKYPLNTYNTRELTISTRTMREHTLGKAFYNEKEIALNRKRFSDGEDLIKVQGKWCKEGWNYNVDESKYKLYTITHEYGHQVEYEYLRKVREQARRVGRRFNFRDADKELRDTLMSATMRKTGEKLTITEFKNKYFSKYAKSKQNYEWFAEIFAQSQLGEKTAFTEAFLEWLEVFYK